MILDTIVRNLLRRTSQQAVRIQQRTKPKAKVERKVTHYVNIAWVILHSDVGRDLTQSALSGNQIGHEAVICKANIQQVAADAQEKEDELFVATCFSSSCLVTLF